MSKNSKEREVFIHWIGPYSIKEETPSIYHNKSCLYQIYTDFVTYKSNCLIYIGSTNDITRRTNEHWNNWLKFYSNVHEAKWYFGFIVDMDKSKKKNELVYYDENELNENKLLENVEKLLIYGHIPPANSSSIGSYKPIGDDYLRIFNLGNFKDLLPELSSFYYADTEYKNIYDKIYSS